MVSNPHSIHLFYIVLTTLQNRTERKLENVIQRNDSGFLGTLIRVFLNLLLAPASQRRAIASRKPQDYGFTRPLVERQKRPSDDETDSDEASVLSETPTDGSSSTVHSGAAPAVGGGGLPSLPRISTVSLCGEIAVKRQRKDVSMSAPAVAARELRQKKKVREEQLMAECETLKADAENVERETVVAQGQLQKLREDATYLRSLVANQQSTVALLEYLKMAPFFQVGLPRCASSIN